MRHCIIGAGFSGLPVGKKLKELGEEFDILDKNTGVGGLWHTGVYRDAHIISSRRTTEFPDYPMPADWPDFPNKAQMQSYLESYATHCGLLPHIQLNTEVVRVRPAADYHSSRAWDVILKSGETRRYRTVTIANGHNWCPNLVTHPGTFSGEILQSDAYQEPEQLTGKRVLVVGYGNTGCDIAVEAARRGISSDISMRSGNYFFPKMFMGIPTADLLYRLPVSFHWLDKLVARIILAFAVGDLSRYGAPRPDYRILEKHPIVNTELLHAIRHGRIRIRPDIDRLQDRQVRFRDGSTGNYDLIVYCTGYRLAFPMLHPEDELLEYRGDLPMLYGQVMAPRYRGLLFTGIGQARTGGGPIFQQLGYLVARIAAFEGRDPAGLMAVTEKQPLLRLWKKIFRNFTFERPASLRSMGIGEVRRTLGLAKRSLDYLGLPDAPSQSLPRPAEAIGSGTPAGEIPA